MTESKWRNQYPAKKKRKKEERQERKKAVLQIQTKIILVLDNISTNNLLTKQ